MRKTWFVIFIGLILAAGCARVQMEAPKEPIKVDISMRLDVYQHVQQDIDDIENIVSGSSDEPHSKLKRSLFGFLVTEVHAAEGLSPEIEQAALRRRDRRAALVVWQTKGVVGENRSGLVEIRMADQANAAVRALVEAENIDRMMIYQAVAQKNGTAVSEVQKLYAKRLQSDATSGTPVESSNQVSGTFEWTIKK